MTVVPPYPPSGKPALVLAVDDDEQSLALIEALLLPIGIHTAKARHGEEALDLVRKLRPDTILLDIMLPGMDGLETLQRLRTIPECNAIPIVMVTAVSGNMEVRIRALESGADDFLCKPVHAAELQARVRNLVRLKESRDRIREHHAELELAVLRRTEALEREMENRRRLELALLDTEARERRRIGHDLHDGLGQVLTGLAMVAKGLELDLKDVNNPEYTKAEMLVTLAGQAKQFVREMMDGLPLAFGNGLNIREILEALATHTREVFGIPCEVRIAHEAKAIAVEADICAQLAGIAREALHNAVKHANPSRLEVCFNANSDHLTLTVADDGEGIPADRKPAGMGLEIMRHRADLIGAALHVESRPGSGTVVTCILEKKR